MSGLELSALVTSAAGLVVLVPGLAMLLLFAVPGWRAGSLVNVGASVLTLLAALRLFFLPPRADLLLHVDAFNIYLVALTAFVGLSTAIFSAAYIRFEVNSGKLAEPYLRFYHAMYQAFMGSMLLALLANNLGVMWVAVEGATLATVLMVSLYRTHESIEAAWKYFILCGVGIALALFGTTILYLAARPVVGTGLDAMTFSTLLPRAGEFNPAILNLAFVFLLVGYGTKVGLAPLHAWLPDAHAEGPTPISAVLSGLLLNVALYAVLRCKMLLAQNTGAIAPGPLMLTMGLASLMLAAFSLWKRRDIKRFFAYSSIEHMGLATFAFGMGGPLANFAGLLHMTMHSLTKSAIFFAVGQAAQVKGTQKFAEISGLTASHPWLGWGLVAGVAMIAGLPPSGVFMSEFLLLTTTFARQPWLAALLALGLLTGLAAMVARIQGVAFGATMPDKGEPPSAAALVPLYLHLALVLVAGVWLPEPLVAWFVQVAALLG